MSSTKNRCQEEILDDFISNPNNFKQVANDLCNESLHNARTQLHPLLHSVELDRLDARCEFIQAFKLGLEQRIAARLATWQPCIQAVFKFDSPHQGRRKCWDSTIHLLVMVSKPLSALKAVGQMLDQSLVNHLKVLRWSRFRTRHTIVNIHQVTPDEVRLGISYGALFQSVYPAPVKIWPQAELAGV